MDEEIQKEARIYVITGRSSSGKTTLIKELEKRGYCVLHETAREVLGERKGYETTKREWIYRQKEMFARQKRQEEEAIQNGNRLIFTDRGLPDVLAYCLHLAGYIPEELKKYDFKGRYSGLFVTEKLPWKKDEIRIEKDDREVEEIHDKIVDAYKNHGYEPISVPAFYGSLEEAVGKRVEFILEKIKDGN